MNTSAQQESPQDAPVNELSYTDASRELDSIVEFFEQRDVDVDRLVERLERATAIVDELDRRIRQTRARVEELVPRLEAVTRSEAPSPSASPGESGRREPGNSGTEPGVEMSDEEFLEEELEVWDDEGGSPRPTSDGTAEGSNGGLF